MTTTFIPYICLRMQCGCLEKGIECMCVCQCVLWFRQVRGYDNVLKTCWCEFMCVVALRKAALSQHCQQTCPDTGTVRTTQ